MCRQAFLILVVCVFGAACHSNGVTSKRAQSNAQPEVKVVSTKTPSAAKSVVTNAKTVATAVPKQKEDVATPPTFVAPKSATSVQASTFLQLTNRGKINKECLYRPMLYAGKTPGCYTKYKRKTMTSEQSSALLSLISSPKTYAPGTEAACFDPHHAFAWYDSKKRVLMEVSLCFSCNAVRIFGTDDAGKTTRYDGGGLSVEGVASFRKICRDVGLARCDQKTYLENMKDAEQ